VSWSNVSLGETVLYVYVGANYRANVRKKDFIWEEAER
jgi:hypothetical protein